MAIQVILEILIILTGMCGMVLHSGLVSGEVRHNFFRYYTNLSNLLVVMFYLSRIIVRILDTYDGFLGRIVFSELWFFSITMVIFLTFGIYHFVLVPGFKEVPPDSNEFKMMHSFSNYCVHYIVPLMCLLNWLVFSQKEDLSYSWALIWTVIPWIYVFWTLIMGALGKVIDQTDSAYPYDFMDVSRHGGKIVARNCVLVAFVFVISGLVLIFIRKLI